MTEVPDKRYIRVTGVYGKDNKLKNYKPSSPVNVDVSVTLSFDAVTIPVNTAAPEL